MAEGSSDPALVERLGHACRSRQLVLLRAVLETAQSLGEVTGPLPPLDDGWTLLSDVQRRDGAAVALVIGLPRTGVWAKEVLQYAETARERALWTVVGYFHQMVAAAAVRAGIDFKWTVPVWRGDVLLPSLGLARVSSRDEWDVAEVVSEDGRVFIHGSAGSTTLPRDLTSDGPDWLALRTLRMGERELWLDDIDPNREFGTLLPPRRLSDAEVDQWAGLFQETWRLLTDHHPAIAGELAAGLSTLVPHDLTNRPGPYSASHNDAFGSVVLSQPPDATTFAETLVHEFGHSKFGVLQSLVDLLEPDEDSETLRLYAPWRGDPRPAMSVLHGVYSFLCVTAFYREHSAVLSGPPARAAQFEFELHRGRTIEGVEGLLAEADLTELGRRFLNSALRQLHAWAVEPPPADVRDAARRANLDNRLCWRIQQLRPVDTSVVALAEAWCAGVPKPDATTDSQLVPVVGDMPTARLALVRAWFANPEPVELHGAAADLLVAETDGETAADLALLGGDTERAVELYRQRILAQPKSSTSWAGLALATGEPALLTHPELVFGVHQEILARQGEAADPVRLARWLS